MKKSPIIIPAGVKSSEQLIYNDPGWEFKPFISIGGETVLEKTINKLLSFNDIRVGSIYCPTSVDAYFDSSKHGNSFSVNANKRTINLKIKDSERKLRVLPEKDHIITNTIISYFTYLRDEHNLDFPDEWTSDTLDIDWQYLWDQFEKKPELREEGFYLIHSDLPFFNLDDFKFFLDNHADTNISTPFVSKDHFDDISKKLMGIDDMSKFDYYAHKMNFWWIKDKDKDNRPVQSRFTGVYYLNLFKDTNDFHEFIESIIQASVVFVDNRHLVGNSNKWEKAGRIFDTFANIRKQRKVYKSELKELGDKAYSLCRAIPSIINIGKMIKSTGYMFPNSLLDNIKIKLLSTDKQSIESLSKPFGAKTEILLFEDRGFSLLYDIDKPENVLFARRFHKTYDNLFHQYTN